jgi:phenylpropionate dioxygenase-like ring-hydroxylating dioxygenase large terminal subunit
MPLDEGQLHEQDVARFPGQSFDDICDEDSRPVAPFVREEVYRYLGSEPISAKRYTSPAVFDQELERLWPRVWQFAARGEEMPDPGDYVVYENAGRSYLLARQPDGSVKAFHNVCLHRGRKLKTTGGNSREFRCPYHGFTWKADGSFSTMPCDWDFSRIDRSELSLPQASVGEWGGYIFVREADEGPSLEDYLDPLQRYLAPYDHANRVTVAWVGKVIPANWKVTMEAFMESYHIYGTHPQILPFTADANSQYNIYGDNVNLAITASAVMSPHLDPSGKTEQFILDAQKRFTTRGREDDRSVRPGIRNSRVDAVPDGMTARQVTAEANRRLLSETYGFDHSAASDSEMQDSFTCHVFPNFAPWGGYMPNIVFRWRPWPDENATLMETRFLAPTAKGAERSRSVPMRMLLENEPWASADELGALGDVIDQDQANLVYVQQGLKASKNGKVRLGDYQEIRIRQFQQTIDKYLTD